jgi:hypothetical protein
MQQDQFILDAFYSLLQEVTDSALRNPELFRRDAAHSLKTYIPRERTVLQSINITVPAGRFFDTWRSELQPTRQALRTNEDNKSFLSSLQKYLFIKDKDATHVAHSLITTQDGVMVDDFIDSLHLPDSRRGHTTQRTIRKLLKWSDKHIESLYEHYGQATVFLTVAAQQNIVIYDCHAGYFARQQSLRAIKKQRKELIKQDKQSIKSIDQSLKTLSKNSLLQQTLATHIEPIEFFGARASYEKKLTTLSKSEASQVVIRNEILIQESKHLKAAYHKLQPDLTSDTLILHDASFDEVVRQLFALSTLQKNRFMLDVKQFRELVRQKETILANQRDRLAIIVSEKASL